jgi:uncharacterized protein (UPF0335 family)
MLNHTLDKDKERISKLEDEPKEITSNAADNKEMQTEIKRDGSQKRNVYTLIRVLKEDNRMKESEYLETQKLMTSLNERKT